eukprot:1159711-Pelagomonas_calceolata.AAC.9
MSAELSYLHPQEELSRMLRCENLVSHPLTSCSCPTASVAPSPKAAWCWARGKKPSKPCSSSSSSSSKKQLVIL